ncbi:MAG: hypothetical protein Q9218_000729 [Villophora microphyllina]
MAGAMSLPDFNDLPLNPGNPPHSAWGLYGTHDQLGTLDRLTDELVATAAKDEIKDGTSETLTHGFEGDGLRHFAYQKEQRFYNGVTLDDIHTGSESTVNGVHATQKDWALHEILLSGWGMPIGELFDLEELAAQCRRLDRWSFFLTSEVCNVPGGVASPANALAIF